MTLKLILLYLFYYFWSGLENIFVTGSKFWSPNESVFKKLEMNTEKDSKFEGFFSPS